MAYLDTISEMVEGRLENAQEYAASAWTYAEQYLGALTDLIQTFAPDFIDLDFDMEPININDYTPDRPIDFPALVQDKIETDLAAGGSGLDADTEQAIYDRQQARQDLINEKRYDEVLGRWSSRGWNTPPGALSAALHEEMLEQTRAEAEISRDVMIKEAELAQANDQFITTSALNFFGHEVGLYQADTQLMSAKIDGEIKSYDVQVQHETNRITIQLKEAEVNLQTVLEAYRVQIEAIKAGGNIYAQLAASAMSSVSAAASMSFSGGYSKNYSEGVSQSYSERHTYDH